MRWRVLLGGHSPSSACAKRRPSAVSPRAGSIASQSCCNDVSSGHAGGAAQWHPLRATRSPGSRATAAMSVASDTSRAGLMATPGVAQERDPATKGFQFQQTMLRIKDPKARPPARGHLRALRLLALQAQVAAAWGVLVGHSCAAAQPSLRCGARVLFTARFVPSMHVGARACGCSSRT